MDKYCLHSSEMHSFIQLAISRLEIEDTELKLLLERAKDHWDLNIISSNCLFTILLEKLLKQNDISTDLITQYYELRNNMYFTIDELESDFIDYIYNYKLPEKKNVTLISLHEARKKNNTTFIDELQCRLKESFEEDLLSVISDYYGKIYN